MKTLSFRIFNNLTMPYVVLAFCIPFSCDKCRAQLPKEIEILATAATNERGEPNRPIKILVSENHALTVSELIGGDQAIETWSLDSGKRISAWERDEFPRSREHVVSADGKSLYVLPEDTPEMYKTFFEYDAMSGAKKSSFNLPFIEYGAETAVDIHACTTGDIAIISRKTLLRSQPVEVLFFSPEKPEGPISTVRIAIESDYVNIVDSFGDKIALVCSQKLDLPEEKKMDPKVSIVELLEAQKKARAKAEISRKRLVTILDCKSHKIVSTFLTQSWIMCASESFIATNVPGTNDQIQIIKANGGDSVTRFNVPAGHRAIHFTSNGKYLITRDSDDFLVWDTTNWSINSELKSLYEGYLYSHAFSKDDKTMLVTRSIKDHAVDGKLMFFDLPDGNP